MKGGILWLGENTASGSPVTEKKGQNLSRVHTAIPELWFSMEYEYGSFTNIAS